VEAIVMKLPRRKFLHLAAGTAASQAFAHIASADAYPTRPVHIVVGFPAGGGTDILARVMGQWLSEHLGQPFVIENRPGAASNVAAEVVVKAPPDGYRLLMATYVNAINATLYDNLNFNFLRDIAPIAGIMSVPNVMEVNPAVPAQTVPEFIAYARANPGRINMATVGSGSGSDIYGALFKKMADVDLVPVPYRGDPPAIAGLLGGQVQVYFGTLAGSIEQIRAGKLRALAVTTATRSQALPDIPTVGDFLPGYEASAWFGVGAPKATPVEIVDTLNREINTALADPNIKARLADLGGTVLAGSPTDFGKLIADDAEKWAKVIKFANIKPD
jgi:tripartite-type tricarboxylate transporter receptor subunit TctC